MTCLQLGSADGGDNCKIRSEPRAYDTGGAPLRGRGRLGPIRPNERKRKGPRPATMIKERETSLTAMPNAPLTRKNKPNRARPDATDASLTRIISGLE